MKLLVVLILSISLNASASLPELFGTSASSIAVGNQADKEGAANNYYASSLLGYSRSTQFSFDFFYIDTDFKEIKKVVTQNSSTTVDSNEVGNFDVNPTPATMMAINFSTPLFSPDGVKFNFSLFAPVDRIIEADTGDPYAPQYVMYTSRLNRPILHFTLAQNFNDWSFGAGVHTGIQTNGEAHFVTRTTSGTNSQGQLSYNAKPSIGALLSVAKKTNNHTTYLNFQQEMKSRFKSNAVSETEVASNAAFQFDLDLTSLLFYDPMTIRLGHQIAWTDSNFYFSLDFQQWDNYETATLNIHKNDGTVNSSKNAEKVKLRNIFIPKIGYEKRFHEKWIGKAGYFYRQSPLKTNNLKNAGNTIDVDKHVASVGIARLFNVMNKEVALDLAYQAHLLRTQKITKTPNEEDGTAGSKIGSPGYDVGGMIHVLSLGISWMY